VNEPDCCDAPLRVRKKAGWKRRLRVLFRLAIRQLVRLELVETDAHGNLKANPIRWIL